MGEIINYYKFAKTNPNLYSLANEYLIKDLIDKNLSGKDKIKELQGMDMESKITGKIIPGMIYSFKYNYQKDFLECPYSDVVPIILTCGLSEFTKPDNKGNLIRGIYIHGFNLNYLNDKERCVLLDFIQTQYKMFFENDVNNAVANNSFALNTNFGKLIMDNNVFARLIENALGIKINEYYRLYNLLLIDNLRLVEFNNWKYIPLLDTRRTVANASISQIRELLNSENK